jgi:hypothetical protein
LFEAGGSAPTGETRATKGEAFINDDGFVDDDGFIVDEGYTKTQAAAEHAALENR